VRACQRRGAPAAAGFASRRRHRQHPAIGGEFEHRLSIFSAQQGELLGREQQLGRKPQRREGIDGAGLGVGMT
jgi:hypothetical protein